jgi:CRISPR-associated protein Cas5d
MSKYEISMEIAGPFAMWSRPDTGATPTSYPVPTWSATKGIFESIAFYSDGRAWIRPVKVEICKPKDSVCGEITFQQYTNNYRGPLRAAGKSNFQLSALILSNVCYRLYGVVENGSENHLKYGDNPCHALQAIFQRRLKKGQCHKTPSLGWNEFVPSYWGEFRPVMEVDTDITINMVSVLKQTFDKSVEGKYNPSFVQKEKAVITEGIFCYD